MTDETTRSLERQAAQGDVDARAKLLLERVRSRDLSEERLKLAAVLGDPASRQALGADAPPTLADSFAAAEGLRAYGQEAGVRVGLALGELARAAWSLRPPELELETRTLAAAADWLRCPCADHSASALELLHAWIRLEVAAAPTPSDRRANLLRAIAGTVSSETYATAGWARATLSAASRFLSPEDMADAIRAEVVPWALGMEPLESRHQADDVFGDVTPYRKGNGES